MDRIVDARGSHCPGPLMELIKAVKNAQVGEVVAVYSTDSGSKTDIPLWVKKAGHELLGIYERDGYTEFVIRKAR
ncbi:MAG: sulfurtransferase TusA family protein [Candidatus Caldarchaeales archaeon]